MTLLEQSTYFADHSELSDPKKYQSLFEGLPKDVGQLSRIIQGLMIHDYFGPHLYGVPSPSFHLASRQTLPISKRICAILSDNNQPISSARKPSERAVGTCRDFALMLCAMLRQHSIPARVRCGFAMYFHPPSYEDHWVCEYWKTDCQRWAIADAQLDETHQTYLSVDFDTTDVPQGQFFFPYRAWHMCRSSTANPANFGHGDDTGAWFIQVNLARDLLSLFKHEVSIWDTWRDSQEENRALDNQTELHCDQIAAISETVSRGLDPRDQCSSPIVASLSIPPWQR